MSDAKNRYKNLNKKVVYLCETVHVETVCVLGNKNRKPDDYLIVNIDADKIHEILDKENTEKEAKEKSQSE